MGDKLARIIKSLRTKEGMTQDELANKIGVVRSTVGNWEQGKRNPDLEQLEEIADLFNLHRFDL